MDIEVNGNIVPLQITPLGEPIDSFLRSFFTYFFLKFDEPEQYTEVIKDYHSDLVANIHSYFDSKINNPPGQDYLFNNLTLIWRNYQIRGRVSDAHQFWQDILNIVTDWEKSRQSRIHKGSLFYFWSQTAIIQGQLDKGFFLIHSAYEEDVLTHQAELPGTPAFKTVSLDYLDSNNFLYKLVEVWGKYLEQFITNYRKSTGRNLTVRDFRSKFLNSPPNSDVLFSFTYTLARFLEFDTLPPQIVQGKFASLYNLNLFFDLVLVIDAVIYDNVARTRPNDWKFFKLADHLLVYSGISTNNTNNSNYLTLINNIGNADFDLKIRELLDQRFVYSGVSPTRLECDIAIAYRVRNNGAHKVISFPVMSERYKDIRQSLFNVLFLAVETYR